MAFNGLQEEPQACLKFVLVGDSTVGKTSLCKQFCDHTFDPRQTQTIGLEFGRRVVDIDGSSVKLQVWDTAGQERFRSVTHAYFRSSAAVLFVFDISNRNSFTSIGSWIADSDQLSPPTATKVLVANKIDLQSQRQVSSHEATEFASHYGLKLFESSALTGERVEDVFLQTAEEAYRKSREGRFETRRAMSLDKKPVEDFKYPSNGYGCCRS